MMAQPTTTPHEATAPAPHSGTPTAAPQPAFANENLPVSEDSPQPEVSAISRKLMAVLAWVERKNLAGAIHGNPGVYDPRLFSWTAELQRNWTAVRGELARLMMRGDLAPKPVGDGEDATAVGNNRSWITYPLSSYFTAFDGNIAHFPETWRLLGKVPGLVSVMFSIFEPGRQLPPHRGPYNGVLRLHLGLIVPEPHDRVGIRIGDDVRHWGEGEILIFDDTFEHEAWNDTGHTRVVLFVDFVKPLRWPARLLNWLVLHSFVFAPLVREGESQRGWRGKLSRDAQLLRKATSHEVKPDSPLAPDLSEDTAHPARLDLPGASKVGTSKAGAASSPPSRDWPFDS